MTSKKHNIIPGSRFYRYDKEGKLVVLKIMGFVNENTLSVVKLMSNGRPDNLKRKIPVDVLVDTYTLLNPDAYITFNIVGVNNEGLDKPVEDIIVTIHKLEDIQGGNNTPYAVTRQNVINTFSTVIMKHETDWEVGMTMSIESVPEGVDYRIMTACDEIKKAITVAAYLDDSLGTIFKCIKGRQIKEMDTVLLNLFLDHINTLPENERRAASECAVHKGYCKTLRDLLVYTEFMYDFERAFGVTNIPVLNVAESIVDGDILNGCIIDSTSIKLIEKAYGFKIGNPIFIKFDKDIRLEDIENEKILIKDTTGTVYLVNYIKDK